MTSQSSDRGDLAASSALQRWLSEVSHTMKTDYDRLHAEARADPQYAGHNGEELWKSFLDDWLPPAYEVAVRKYIVPEQGDDRFETDIVIYHPSYPTGLRKEVDVLPGGVAAAFYCRLTCDPNAIEDAWSRAVRLRKSMVRREGSPQTELLGLFPVGLLCPSHIWTRPRSTPTSNIESKLNALHMDTDHPSELLDLLCVADLRTWACRKMPYLTPEASTLAMVLGRGIAMSGMFEMNAPEGVNPLFGLLINLYRLMSHRDPSVATLEEGFRFVEGSGGPGIMREWDSADIYSEGVQQRFSGAPYEPAPGHWYIPM